MNTFTESSGRKAQKEATRARILEIAKTHFERDGFDGASVRAIAADAGVAAGTVLLHFADKRDLLHAALEGDLSLMIERVLGERRQGKLESRLRAIARPFFAYYAERPALSKTLLREALLAEPPWRERFTAQVARVHAQIVALTEAAKERGELAASVDGALLGAAFFSFYYFALIAWVQQGIADPAPLFERLLAEHMRGLPRPTSRRRSR